MIYKVISSSDLKLIGYITHSVININKVILLRDGGRTRKFDVVFMKGSYGNRKLTLKNSNNSIFLIRLDELK